MLSNAGLGPSCVSRAALAVSGYSLLLGGVLVMIKVSPVGSEQNSYDFFCVLGFEQLPSCSLAYVLVFCYLKKKNFCNL